MINLLLIGLGIALAIYLTQNDSFHRYLLNLGELGYLGSFIGGMLFVSTFTVATGGLILVILSQRLSALEVGLIAGAGAMETDMITFHLVKDTLRQDIKAISKRFGGKHLSHVLHTKYFHWTLPVIGALIIASPLPDELGVGLLGISKMNAYEFAILSFVLNFLGIFLVISASTVFNA